MAKNKYLLLYSALLIVFSIYSCSGVRVKSDKDDQLAILKDSLLIKKSGYLDLNLSKEDLDKIEIIPINIYRLKNVAKDYVNESNFKKFVKFEKNRIDGYIYLRNEVIGYIQAFYDGNTWNMFGGVQILNTSNPKKSITKLLSKKEISNLYIVIGLDCLWIDKGNGTFVYNFYLEKPAFVPVRDYIYKTLTKEALVYAIDLDGYFP